MWCPQSFPFRCVRLRFRWPLGCPLNGGKSRVWGVIPQRMGRVGERGHGHPLAWCGLLRPLGLSIAASYGPWQSRGGSVPWHMLSCTLVLDGNGAPPTSHRGEGTFQLPAFPVQRALPAACPDPSETLASLRLQPQVLCALCCWRPASLPGAGFGGCRLLTSLPARTSPGTAVWQHQLVQGRTPGPRRGRRGPRLPVGPGQGQDLT